MTVKELEQSYHQMIELKNYSEASSIAFQIAALVGKQEEGWCGCESLKCQQWMELGYENARQTQKFSRSVS